jgi:hypothetical protein
VRRQFLLVAVGTPGGSAVGRGGALLIRRLASETGEFGMVKMRAVDSSWVRAIGYDEAAEELWAEFDSSPDPYIHFEVPPEVFGSWQRRRASTSI